MKNILYVEPKHGDKTYNYYNYLGTGLIKIQKEGKINLFINKCDFNNPKYDLILFGYGACSSHKLFKYDFSNINTPKIGFLFKLSNFKDIKFNFFFFFNIIVFSHHTRQIEFEKIYNINLKPIPYPFDDNIFYDYKLPKKYDVCMTGALHNIKYYSETAYLKEEKNIRQRIVKLLEDTNYKNFIKCNDKGPEESRIMNNIEYAKTINSSKIWIGTNSDHGDLTPRASEIIGCKTLLFYNEHPYDTFNDSFKDGETCVFFKNDLSNLKEKIDYYLENEVEYNRIVNNAYQLFHNNYTCKKIAEIYVSLSK